MKQVLTIVLLFYSMCSFAQSKRNDISVSELPAEVKTVLEQYAALLRSAQTLEQAADEFLTVAGGTLVNEDGKTLRPSVMPYSLKKDWSNIKFYASPIRITRVNLNPNARTSGYGPSAIKGKVYKIWIDKSKGQNGLPAPVSILYPQDHAFVNDPKIIGIGSF